MGNKEEKKRKSVSYTVCCSQTCCWRTWFQVLFGCSNSNFWLIQHTSWEITGDMLKHFNSDSLIQNIEAQNIKNILACIWHKYVFPWNFSQLDIIDLFTGWTQWWFNRAVRTLWQPNYLGSQQLVMPCEDIIHWWVQINKLTLANHNRLPDPCPITELVKDVSKWPGYLTMLAHRHLRH